MERNVRSKMQHERQVGQVEAFQARFTCSLKKETAFTAAGRKAYRR